MKHTMKLNGWPFESIKSGKKIYELRLYDEKRSLINIGDTIEFTNRDTGEVLLVSVEDLLRFNNFEELYKNIDKNLMGYKEDEITSYKDMEEFYSIEEQSKYGVVAIKIKLKDNK